MADIAFRAEPFDTKERTRRQVQPVCEVERLNPTSDVRTGSKDK